MHLITTFLSGLGLTPATALSTLSTLTTLTTLTALWPVGPPPPDILRGWHPPPGPYAAGHRGVDLAAPPGAPVLAPAAGTVTFAGPVGGRGVVTLTLTGTGTPPLRTTFSPVTPLIAPGTRVAPGTPLARVSTGTHCPESCLHWGLLRGDTYLNPLRLLHRPPSRLLPLRT
ncbi:M23 family metallopeptidase [Streptomyces sp. NPDC003327]